MRVLLPSVLAALFALILGVAAHHTITTEHFEFGLACLLTVCIGCFGIGLITLRAAKKESRWWPRITSSAVIVGLAWIYIQLISSSYFPSSLKVMHAVTCGVILLWAILLMTSKPKRTA